MNLMEFLYAVIVLDILYLIQRYVRKTRATKMAKSIPEAVATISIDDSKLVEKVASKVTDIRPVSSDTNIWDTKLKRNAGVTSSRRRNVDPNQLILSDLED